MNGGGDLESGAGGRGSVEAPGRDAPAYSSSAAGRVLRPEGMRDGDRGGREADKGSVCDCVGDHGGGERHGRACGWNSFACAASARFFFFSFPLCPRASSNRLERDCERNGRPTNLAPHWASSTKYHERIIWDKIQSKKYQ